MKIKVNIDILVHTDVLTIQNKKVFSTNHIVNFSF